MTICLFTVMLSVSETSPGRVVSRRLDITVARMQRYVAPEG